MKKNKDKKINEQQARPAPEEIIPEEKNIPVREDTEDIADKDTVPQDGVQEPAAERRNVREDRKAVLLRADAGGIEPEARLLQTSVRQGQ